MHNTDDISNNQNHIIHVPFYTVVVVVILSKGNNVKNTNGFNNAHNISNVKKTDYTNHRENVGKLKNIVIVININITRHNVNSKHISNLKLTFKTKTYHCNMYIALAQYQRYSCH